MDSRFKPKNDPQYAFRMRCDYPQTLAAFATNNLCMSLMSQYMDLSEPTILNVACNAADYIDELISGTIGN